MESYIRLISVMRLVFWTVCSCFCAQLAAKGSLVLLERPLCQRGCREKINPFKNRCFTDFLNKTISDRQLLCSDFTNLWHRVMSATKEGCLNPVTSQINSALWSHHISLIFLSLQCEKTRCRKRYEGRKRNEDIEKERVVMAAINLCIYFLA